tara:strand:- start:876 stop:1286 length:411 start_codon:yes stop_codon:yes gene_type:complete
MPLNTAYQHGVKLALEEAALDPSKVLIPASLVQPEDTTKAVLRASALAGILGGIGGAGLAFATKRDANLSDIAKFTGIFALKSALTGGAYAGLMNKVRQHDFGNALVEAKKQRSARPVENALSKTHALDALIEGKA